MMVVRYRKRTNFQAIDSVLQETQAIPVPAMTSNSYLGYTASCSGILGGDTSYAYVARDQADSTFHGPSVGDGGLTWVQIQLPNVAVANTLTIKSRTDGGAFPQLPAYIGLQGSNNGTDFTTILADTSSGFTAGSETRSYTITSPGSYLYYRVRLIAGGSGYAAIANAQLTYV